MIVQALVSLRPGAQWTLDGDSYSGLTWKDETQTQPTEEEVAQEVLRLTAELPNKLAKENRARAYQAEADPMFFKAQRGEITQQEWLDKIAEIQARYPYQ